MDIENLGTAVVEQLVSCGFAKDPADLYTLKLEMLLDLDKFAINGLFLLLYILLIMISGFQCSQKLT